MGAIPNDETGITPAWSNVGDGLHGMTASIADLFCFRPHAPPCQGWLASLIENAQTRRQFEAVAEIGSRMGSKKETRDTYGFSTRCVKLKRALALTNLAAAETSAVATLYFTAVESDANTAFRFVPKRFTTAITARAMPEDRRSNGCGREASPPASDPAYAGSVPRRSREGCELKAHE